MLLLTFGSLVAMGLPILTALFALGVGLSLVTLGTHVFDTAEFAPQLAAMIGLGVGIDYALFILTRFRNGLDEGLEPREAAIAAVDTAGRAVLFAGITVIIALMGMMLLGLSFLYGVAMAAAIAVLFTMIAALTLLPALLTIAGRRVDRLRIPGLGSARRRPPRTPAGSAGAARSSAGRSLSALLSGGLLLVLCIPTLSLRLGSNDAGTDPAGTTTREAYDLLAEGFGPGFNGPFSIVAALPAKGDDAALTELRKTLEDEEGVAETTAGDAQPGREHRRLPGLPDHLAAERGDDRAARPHPRRADPAGRGTDRRPGPRRRHHRDLRGLRHRDRRQAAALHRRRRRCSRRCC